MRVLVLLVVGFVLVLPGAGRAVGEPHLIGTVGPGTTITLTDAAGTPVTSIAAGTYDVLVRDLSSSHNFHLKGPGVDEARQASRARARRRGKTSSCRRTACTPTNATPTPTR
ncbi:MAG TPA: hypothetical protein VG144_13855 [Gaiellaceae bacterium]|nr:hypothetical protein [Gaiellaceae bacterium]